MKKNLYNKERMEGHGEHPVADFIKYNNAVPIVFGLLFLLTTGTFAASPAVRDAVYAEEEAVRSVDNSYLLSTDLEDYDFSMRVTAIEEDEEWIYVAYDFDTIALVDAAWQDATEERVLRVSKALLRGGDLKAYVESELSQVRDFELSQLVQAKAREEGNGLTQKTVATVYKGIVGDLIKPSEETAPFYQPPPEKQAKNDPLRIRNPEPLVAWDLGKADGHKGGDDGIIHHPGVTDYCANMEGVQEDPALCAVTVVPAPGDEPPATTTPPAEPPGEEVTPEEPSTEEPSAEAPPSEEEPSSENPPGVPGDEVPSV